MLKRFSNIICFIGLFGISVFAQDPIEQAKADVHILTSKEFAGRGFTFDGNKKAEEFLIERFKKIGLEPVDGKYGQPFNMELNIVDGVPQLSVNNQQLKIGSDFLPNSVTGSGSIDGDTPIYYVKSGLYIKEKGINDYSGVTSKSAVLIFEDEVPDSIKADTTIDSRRYSTATRLRNAEVLQAKGVIFLVKRLMFAEPYIRKDFPVFDVLRTSLPMPVETISYKVKSSFDEVEPENLIGTITGLTQSDSTIIICAHYDHLSAFADTVYFPGANDNASGTAMLLSLAQYFKINHPRHKIIFIAFSGEEEGLIGSKYYSEHPIFPLNKTVFLVNLDMVASGDDGIMAVGGVDYPDFYSKLKTVNDSLNLGPLYKRACAPNSDQYFLSVKGVKTFYLYTNQGKQPYHNIQDVDSTLDWKAFNHTLLLVKGFIKAIDN